MWSRALASRWWILLIIVGALLLASPALHAGFIMDDFWHWEILTGRLDNRQPGSFLGLFSFVIGDPERTHRFMDIGVFPWWTAESLRLTFWRPLAELTHWLDYRLWPDSPLLMHAHNLVWYGALIALVGYLLRTLDTDRVAAGIGVLLFGLNSMHGTTVGWIANRNSLIGACFTVVALLCFHRWRQRQQWRYGFFAALAFTAGLFSAEAALATLAYVVAYLIALERSTSLPRRLLALLPFLIIVAIWKLLYVHFGYGSFHSGVYIDPSAEVTRFVPALAQRLPILLFAQLFGISSAFFGFVTLPLLYWGIAIFFVVLFFWFASYLRVWQSPLMRFYTIGMLIALIPVCATSPDDRLLLLADIGASGLLGKLFCAVWVRCRDIGHRFNLAQKTLIAWLGFMHFIAMPLYLPTGASTLSKVAAPFSVQPALSLPNTEITPATEIIFINSPVTSFVAYMPFVRDWYGLVRPRAMVVLGPGTRAMALTVIDAFTIELTVDDGFITPMDNFFRDSTLTFKAGDSVDIRPFQARIVQVMSDGRPRVVQFRFPGALTQTNRQFYTWIGRGYQRLNIPPVGTRVELAALDLGAIVAANK